MIVKNFFCSLLCIVVFSFAMHLATAQQRSSFNNPTDGASTSNYSAEYLKTKTRLRKSDSLKIGLVLSGGGAKGFAHIGALKVIEESGIPIDYITGTSMGAVIGGLYASGYNATQLDSLARTINWQRLISEQSQRRQLTTFEKKLDEKFLINLPITEKGIDLPQGLISGQNVYELLTQLTKNVHLVQDFDQLPIPFRAVATNLETAEATVFGTGYLPDAIRASISIPSIFIPYEISSNVYVDGGLIRNLPVTDVLEMGADIVISVDVGEPLKKFKELNSMIEVLNQAVLLHASKENQIQQSLSNIHIAPPLDTLKGYSISDFGKAVELVNFGEWMARPFKNQLDSLAARIQTEKKTSQRHVYEPESIKYQLTNIEITGLKNLTRNFIVTELNLDISKPVTLEEINTAVNKLHGTGFFETIRYNIEQTRARHQLILQIKEANANKVRSGFRFDSEREAALILNSTFRNIFNTPSLSQANLRLGERIFANIQYISTPGNRPRFGISTDVSYLKDDITWFDEEIRISSFTSHNYRIDLFAGLLLNNTIELGFGARQDFFNLGNEINTAALPFTDDNFFSVYGRFWLDTYNRLHFPTSGQSFLIEYNLAESELPASANFTRQLFYGDWIFPASDKIAFNLTTLAGRSTGSELPQPYWFNFMEIDRSLRTDRFVGYEDDEDAAKNMFMLGAGMQYEFSFNKFLILSGNIGNRFNVWKASRFTETNLSGVGIGLGINTFLGPVKLTTSYSERNDLFVRLDIGYRF